MRGLFVWLLFLFHLAWVFMFCVFPNVTDWYAM